MTPAALLVSVLIASAHASPWATPDTRAIYDPRDTYYGAALGLSPPSGQLERRSQAWAYAGCYAESSNGERLLKTSSYRSPAMSVLKCQALCASDDALLAGLENGDECWCGTALSGDGGKALPDAECSTPCPEGDENCGAAFKLSVYKRNTDALREAICGPALEPPHSAASSPMAASSAGPASATASPTAESSVTASPTAESSAAPAPSASASATAAVVVNGVPWTPLGCAVDADARVLSSFAILDDPKMTTERCLTVCGNKEFDFCGMHRGTECFGGNSVSKGTHYDEGACTAPCTDGKGMCGGSDAVTLFRTAGDATAPPASASSGAPVITTPDHVDTANSTTTTGPSTGNKTDVQVTDGNRLNVTGGMDPAPPQLVPGTAAPPPSAKEHKVWAHFMVGFTFAYTAKNWDVDIAAAKASGIDGFALNFGRDPWQPKQLRMAYDAAKRAGGFKLFLSMDMNSLECTTAGNATTIRDLVKEFAADEAQATWDGKVLVSTFAGQQCSFGLNATNFNATKLAARDNVANVTGAANATATNVTAPTNATVPPPPPPPPAPFPDAWGPAFVAPLKAAGVDVFFVPALFLPPAQVANYSWVDGAFAWNSAWPGAENATTELTDSVWQSALEPKGKLYVPALSPGFFAHYGPDSYDKNWIYESDDWLYCTRWEAIISQRERMPMLEIVTWNDFTESSYLAPYPNNASLDEHSPAWVEGFDHEPLQALTKYYATAYKEGSYPAIEADSLVLWSRPHPKLATASNDTVPRPKDADKAEDSLFAVVLAKAPARVTVYSGQNRQTFDVPAGLSKLKIPSAPGSIGGWVERDGQRTSQYDSKGKFEYTAQPKEYNFNTFVGASAPPQAIVQSFAAVPPRAE